MNRSFNNPWSMSSEGSWSFVVDRWTIVIAVLGWGTCSSISHFLSTSFSFFHFTKVILGLRTKTPFSNHVCQPLLLDFVMFQLLDEKDRQRSIQRHILSMGSYVNRQWVECALLAELLVVIASTIVDKRWSSLGMFLTIDRVAETVRSLDR